MIFEKITPGKLAKALCEELNKSPIEKATLMTDHFARQRKMVCTRVLLPTEPGTHPVTKILQVWLDNHHFWIYRHGNGDGGEWKIHGSA
jgi:hypothetical protein